MKYAIHLTLFLKRIFRHQYLKISIINSTTGTARSFFIIFDLQLNHKDLSVWKTPNATENQKIFMSIPIKFENYFG